jgi:hypothetical protein
VNIRLQIGTQLGTQVGTLVGTHVHVTHVHVTRAAQDVPRVRHDPAPELPHRPRATNHRLRTFGKLVFCRLVPSVSVSFFSDFPE